MRILIVPIISAMIMTLSPCGAQPKRGDVVGSVAFVSGATQEFVADAPDVSIDLDFRGRTVKLRSNPTGRLVESLPVGTYCLKAAYDLNNKPLAFSPKQYKCFKIKADRDTRFDVMLLKPES